MPSSEGAIPDPFARVRALGDKAGGHGRRLGVAAAVALHALASAHAWAAARGAIEAPVPARPAELEVAVDVEPAATAAHETAVEAPAPAEPRPSERVTAASAVPAARPATDPYDGAPTPSKAPEVVASSTTSAGAATMASGDGSGPGHGAVAGAGAATTATPDMQAQLHAVPAPPAAAPREPASPAPPVDRSRAPALAGGTAWRCPFPPEAESDQVDQAVATIVVTVGSDGSPTAVTVVGDPGHGFGRAARACAFGRRYTPGLDGSGAVHVATTAPIRVRFTR